VTTVSSSIKDIKSGVTNIKQIYQWGARQPPHKKQLTPACPGLPLYDDSFVPCREQIFNSINEKYNHHKSSGKSNTLVIWLYGEAECGKTSLVVRYAYEHIKNHDIIFFVKASNEKEIEDSYIVESNRLRIHAKNDSIGITISKIQSTYCQKRFLLIYDDLQERKLIEKFTPQVNGLVLVTSRSAHPKFQTIPVTRYIQEKSSEDEFNKFADEKKIDVTKKDQRLGMGTLDLSGNIHLDITIPWAELKIQEPPLGDGGFGIVYAGSWRDQPVAVKKLKIQRISEKTLFEFCREAQIMFELGLESNYVVKLKKICLEAPNYALVMELMTRGSLYEFLRNSIKLPSWKVRYKIALDVACGLCDLHSRSIFHKDLKSMNILLDEYLNAKLTDFGLAQLKQETATTTSLIKGTAQWMAPELFEKKTEITTAVDIYSFGMVLWELVTGEIPFKTAPNQTVVIGWIIKGEKEEIPETCPPGLKKLILSCWDKPENRPSAKEIVTQLKFLLLKEEKGESSISSLSETPLILSTETESITEVPGTLFYLDNQASSNQKLQIPTLTAHTASQSK
jgi:tRNA A-37 threonylcarbamoyl transferase component Bud32